jgi:hypothetical protein
MATRAEEFRAEQMRATHAKKPKRASRDPAGKLAKARGRAKDRFPNPTSHNEAPRAAKNSAYELEPDQTTRPPRKSTRRSKAHIKTDASLRITTMNANTSPQAQNAQGRSRRVPRK